MRRVLSPLVARAAARLIAVVVFPTPPFWFAMQMITESQYSCLREFGDGCRAVGPVPVADSHPTLAEVLRIHFFEPLLESLRVRLFPVGLQRLALLEDFLLHEDFGVHAQRERDRVARPAVHVPPR